jgi:FemAB-related protein (PEP-CTERM system-associated)
VTTGTVATQDVQVRQLQDGEEGEWDGFVRSCPSGTLFHLAAWRRVTAAVLGHESIYLVARRGTAITGVLPLSRVRNRLFGDCLVSMPLAVYGGICATDADSYSQLLSASGEIAKEAGVKYVEMRNRTEPFATNLAGRDLYVTFTQDLTLGPDKLLERLPRDTRYMVRKSLKNGLTWASDISLAEFYDIYARSVHRLGTPVFPMKLFAQVMSEFADNCRVFGVRKGSQAIAAVLCLYFEDRVMPYYGGSLAEFNRDAPNNFMYWNLIAQSCAEGLRYFDFGRSKKGTGAYQFKSSWAMQEAELPYRYLLVKAREVPHLSPVDQKFQLPVALWKRMPYSWTKVLGPAVVQWIPSI